LAHFQDARLDPTLGLLGFAAGACTLALPFADPWNRVWVGLGIGLVLLGLIHQLTKRRLRHTLTGPIVDQPSAIRIAGPAMILLAAIGAGYLYGSLRTGAALERRVPPCADTVVRRFLVTIRRSPELRSDPVTGRSNARFEGWVRVEPADAQCPGLSQHRVRLTWYGAPVLAVGETWRVDGKLRPPWGYRNPGGFDYERWLLGAGLDGTGYIRSGKRLERGVPTTLGMLRRDLKAWVEGRRIRHDALVLALLLGDDSRITSEQWDRLRASGTIHLLVVSGLHVGLIAGCLLAAGRGLARLAPALMLRFGAQRLGSGLALAGSGAYVLLTGAGVPAVRAWLMAGIVLIALASGRRPVPFRLLAVVLALVLLRDPLAVHQQGFWLSFAAVFVLVGYFVPRHARGWNGTLLGIGRFAQAQLALLVGLSPLLALSQGAVVLHSPLANALAVPLVTVVILPLLLAVSVLMLPLPGLAGALLRLADGVLDLVMRVVNQAASVGSAPTSVDGWLEVALAVACVAWLGLAPGVGRALPGLLVWVAILLLPASDPVLPGEFRVLALDVGQGSAALIETRRHSLIYDTGPAYPSGFNLGEAAVVPTYRRLHSPAPDVLVLSHDDVDHTGGAVAVASRLAPAEIWSSFQPASLHRRGRRCGRGVSWRWDGVQFTFLHPDLAQGSIGEAGAGRTVSDNDQSCVLLVAGAHRRALLAGDISAAVERRLEVPSVDLLFAPHHGSRTSSSPRFVERTRPSHVIVSTARRSRYGHPHGDVVERYLAIGAAVHVTGWHGALQWDSHRPRRVKRWREDERAYWHRVTQ
jgi:competence protein ComEC